MVRNLLTTVIGLLSIAVAYGQSEFQRTYGGIKKENCSHIISAKDNCFFSIGSTESFGKGGSDIYLIKTDSIGNLLWAKSYGSAMDDFGTYMDRTKDGNYIIAGYTSGFNGTFSDICLIKINDEGEIIWSKTYGLDKSDFATSVQCTSDGGFIILGETINFIGNDKNSDMLIVKTNAEGVIEWSKVCGGNNTDYGYSIQELKNGGYIIGGETNSYGAGNWDFYLLKLRQDGEVEWSKTFGSNNIDYGRYAVECPDGGFIIGGNTAGFDAQLFDFCLIKTDAMGKVQWSKIYGGNGTDYLLSLKIVNESGFAFTGYSNSQPCLSEDACVAFLDYSGKAIWARLYGSDLHDAGVSLTLSSNKNELIMGGSTSGFGTRGDDMLIIKMPVSTKSQACNRNYFYPFLSRKIEVLSNTGHYQYDLHCDEKKVTFFITKTVSAEQILCNTVIGGN